MAVAVNCRVPLVVVRAVTALLFGHVLGPPVFFSHNFGGCVYLRSRLATAQLHG